ncbi:hypothetical protein DPQ33_16295 [Oceanidesulfovibrio indonesiensis]|uniref:Uncharacterized protein n=1 Tax=Oceanidesulfovibrio indonesiensis TaxID=54767 RepID=A0A7M3MBN4_9BACT|nr:hypothetical protein DPQ33_16295 [Oceanidesulfovibrio indonesiensis]
MHDSLRSLPTKDLRKLVEEIQSTPGVDYSGRYGAVCPVCGAERCRVTATGPWIGSCRERFHRCRTCGLRFKSVETDHVGEGSA